MSSSTLGRYQNQRGRIECWDKRSSFFLLPLDGGGDRREWKRAPTAFPPHPIPLPQGERGPEVVLQVQRHVVVSGRVGYAHQQIRCTSASYVGSFFVTLISAD